MLVCMSKTQIVFKFHLTPQNPNQAKKKTKTIPTLGKVKGQERRTKFQFLIKKLFVSHHESIAHLTKHVPSGPQTSDSICPRSNYTLIQLCTELMYRRQSYLFDVLLKMFHGIHLNFNSENYSSRCFWLEQGSKTVLRSTHLVEQLPFTMTPLNLTFQFDLIMGSFFTFWSPNCLLLGSGQESKMF